MTKLDAIKKYAESLSKASKWIHSREQITSIEAIKKDDSKKAYVYEFYCLLRILDDLKERYDIEITNTSNGSVFPKSPASKKNFPYFIVKEKGKNKVLFEICAGVDVKGLADETSAPDISFQIPQNHFNPTHKEVFMIFDSKFKHSLSAKVSGSEFNNVAGMIRNLSCENAHTNVIMDFHKNNFKGLKGNCILTNGRAYKLNEKHNRLFNVKVVEMFDEGVEHKIIG